MLLEKFPMRFQFRSSQPVPAVRLTGASQLSYVLAVSLVATAGAASGFSQTANNSSQASSNVTAEFFRQNIQPILANHCYDCHSAGTRAAGGLQLDSRASIVKGGDLGPAIVPGNPDGSLLIQRVSSTDTTKRMPFGDDPLSAKDIADLKKWIASGALWPDARTV